MIVRILNEGQWNLPDETVADLNTLDDAVEQAVTSGDQDSWPTLCTRCWSMSGPPAPRCPTMNSRTPT